MSLISCDIIFHSLKRLQKKMTQGKTKSKKKSIKNRVKRGKKSKIGIKRSTKQKLFSKLPRLRTNNKRITSAINNKNEKIAISNAIKNGEQLSFLNNNPKRKKSKKIKR